MEATSLERVRRSQKEWRGILERQSQSGMTVGRFCETEGIPQGCFYRWRRQFSRPPATAFVELSTEMLNRSRVRAELDLGQGMVFRIFG